MTFRFRRSAPGILISTYRDTGNFCCRPHHRLLENVDQRVREVVDRPRAFRPLVPVCGEFGDVVWLQAGHRGQVEGVHSAPRTALGSRDGFVRTEWITFRIDLGIWRPEGLLNWILPRVRSMVRSNETASTSKI